MDSTPPRRLALATVALALVATASAAPAQARTIIPTRMPAAARHAPDPPATAVTPLGVVTTAAGGRVPRWPAPVRRTFTRTPTTDPAAVEVVRLVNVERQKAGCRALRVDDRLTRAARLHSEDMAARNYFSHTSLDGRSPWDRIAAQGYTNPSAENIAAGQRTPATVMAAWMNSPGHKANIVNCASRAIGVGIGHGGSYGTYWTQDFGYS